MAPVQRGLQRLLAAQRRAAPTRQQAKAVVQPRGDLLNGEGGHAGHRQLNGQRYAVELAAYSGDGRRILLLYGERGQDGPRAVHEEPDRLGLHQSLEVWQPAGVG